MKKPDNKEISLEDVIRAFVKNKQVQAALEAMKASANHKENKVVKLEIKVAPESTEFNLVDGEEKVSIFEDTQTERAIKKDEIKLRESLASIISPYIMENYLGVNTGIADKAALKLSEKISNSVILEIDKALREIWDELSPKKGS